MDLKTLRKQLSELLSGGHAHMSVLDAVKDFPVDKINSKAQNVDYSFYALLEHIRRTQADILEYIIDPHYKDKTWPKDYWPDPTFKASEKDWKETIRMFKEDVEKLVEIANKKNVFANVPNGATILKELLMVADHNAYHVGEFAILRQVENNWGKGHD